VTPSIHAKVMREIIRPTLEGMIAEGTPFTGFLYAGVMISPSGEVRTLEFNTRLGDPETQPIMMRLKSDLLDVLWVASEPAVNHRSLALEDLELEWDRRLSLGVVMASHGYPEEVRTGDAIAPLPKDEDDRVIFHAGTKLKDQSLLTSGGRVLCVTALADTITQAQQKVYGLIDEGVRFEGMQFRRDIGWRAKR
jgi:phosphoribosylamine--glycine ligase